MENPEQLAGLEGKLIECELPNADLYAFEGALTLDNKIPITAENCIWRGCTLMNTHWIVGLVVFTGQETKLIKNSRPTPAKRSRIEVVANLAIGVIFFCLAAMCSISTVLQSSWLETRVASGAWYLTFIPKLTNVDVAASWITFLILYNNLVPISLYVSLELVKLFQSRLINTDVDMYHEESNTPALARTTNLNEDLGQVEYIFSDKTGTLTMNEMEFKKCSVGGITYGSEGEKEAARIEHQRLKASIERGDGPERPAVVEMADLSKLHSSSSNASVSAVHEEKSPSAAANGDEIRDAELGEVLGQGVRRHIKKEVGMPGYNFDDRVFLHALKKGNVQSKRLEEFLVSLAVCHTVIPERDDNGRLTYQSASPDEGALVAAARFLGAEFHQRGNKLVVVNQFGEDVRYEVLAVNAFSSKRKRMSVLVRRPDESYVLYCKGADDIMVSLIKETLSDDLTILKNHLFEFASDGLRTLVVGKVEVDSERAKGWLRAYDAASVALEDRDQKLKDLAADIEQDLTLVGATAIEDKLQDGVPEAIEKLTQAGIKVWMLTGDKLETAQNIGYSCRLLTRDMEVAKIDERTSIETSLALARLILNFQNYIGRQHPNLGVVVTGQSLGLIFNSDDMKKMFLEICKMAKVVVACRVIPSQKAEIVRLVRLGIKPHPLTLAIGDGANDVAMIQEAHVGIGISGNEGMQAVRASDYSFAQFRFLVKLLLVHGHWNYRRVAFLILYCFYKNIVVVLTLFYFGFLNGWSGMCLPHSPSLPLSTPITELFNRVEC